MFFSSKSKIFDTLVEQGMLIEKASEKFHSITLHMDKVKEGADVLADLEHQGDTFVHTITDEIEKAFIPPLDKEDIKLLTDLMDDVLDDLEQTADRLKIYNLTGENEALSSFAALISQSANKIQEGILLIQRNKLKSDEFKKCYWALHEIEGKGDKLHRKTLEEMMGKGKYKDLLLIIKWKEIYETLENTLDTCEDIAIVFERLKIKYT